MKKISAIFLFYKQKTKKEENMVEETDNCHTLISGEKINLDLLTKEEMDFWKEVKKAYLANELYPYFVNRIYRSDSPIYRDGSWMTSEVSSLALYKICEDLEFRLGISQGFIGK